jgi:hypothetical protein
MAQETIHPTNHAIDRFEERILPLLPDDTRTQMNDKKKIKQRLYGLARRAEIIRGESCMEQVLVLFNVQGHPPIPLTLVIDHIKKTLITLYISPGWTIDESNDQRTVWRWSA